MKKMLLSRILSVIMLFALLFALTACDNRQKIYNNHTMHTVTSFGFTDDGKARISVDYTGYDDTQGAFIQVKIEKQNFLFFWEDFVKQSYIAEGNAYQNEYFYPVEEKGTYRCTVTYTVLGDGQDDIITFTDTETYQIHDTAAETTDTTESTENPPVTPAPVGFISPDDEIETTKTFFKENDDIRLEFTFYGYASESLGEEFYLKSNERIRASAKATNLSDGILYNHSSVDIYRIFRPDFRTENDIPLACDNSWYWGTLAMKLQEIAPGESLGYNDLKLIAGEHVTDEEAVDIYLSDYYINQGYRLFDRELYRDDVLKFSGNVSFSYGKTWDPDYDIIDSQDIVCEITDLKIFYVDFDKEERYPVFTAPEDEVKTKKAFAVTNDDGIQIGFTIEGYSSESLGEKFYLKNNELIHATVRVNNTYPNPVFQTTSYYCHQNIGNRYAPPECAHEFTFDIKYDENVYLNYDDFGCYHIDRDITWTLAGGESFSREELVFGVGYYASETSDIDIYTFEEKERGYVLYGRGLYENGSADFTGKVSFSYTKEDGSEQTISCDVDLKVFFVAD
ncbi:MAG: hypothetical protein IJ489_03225 [Clostridia bacterium]|nr:hypothetical protein [Clostridia bacterium]